MHDGFELLEEKVRKAAELVKQLRRENKALGDDLLKSKVRVQEAEKRLQSLEQELQKAGKQDREAEALQGEVESLREERDDVRKRISKLLEVLDGLE